MFTQGSDNTMEETEGACLFSFTKYCAWQKGKSAKWTEVKPARIKTVIESSKDYQDGFAEKLQLKVDADESFSSHAHMGCVSTYTSTTHRNRAKKSASTEKPAQPQSSKRSRRSDTPIFDFLKGK